MPPTVDSDFVYLKMDKSIHIGLVTTLPCKYKVMGVFSVLGFILRHWNSFVLSVCSLMVSSLISTLLLSQSSEFLIPVIAFFSSVISNLLFL